MSQSVCSSEGLADAVLRELRVPSGTSAVGDELINAIVDAMVQANVDLETVTTAEMKCLIAGVLRPTVRRPRRSGAPQFAMS